MDRDDSYSRVVTGAGVWDRSAAGRLSVRGTDRRSWLHGLVTNDVAHLTPGTGCYAALLTPQGRMIADVRLLETGTELLADVAPDTAAALIARLDAFVITEDVALADRTAELARYAIHGPQAASVLAAALELSFGEEAALRHMDGNAHRHVPWGDDGVRIARSRELALVGFDVYAAVSAASALRDRLAAQDAAWPPASVHETLRIEAGIPAFGIDMDEQTIPLEAGIEGEAISFDKGCYVGQEVIVRVMHRGHGRVARRLMGLVFEPASAVAERNASVFHGGGVIGRVTSATWSPRLGRPIALAYVHRDHAVGGTAVEVAHAAERLPATVVALPFGHGATDAA